MVRLKTSAVLAAVLYRRDSMIRSVCCFCSSHVALTLALEKRGIGPKEYVAVSVPGGQLVQSLESGFIDAAALNPPTMFFAQRRGYVRLLDIGSLVEMASGGLTAMTRTGTSSALCNWARWPCSNRGKRPSI